MLKALWSALTALAASKKFSLAVIAALVWVVGKVGLHVDQADMIAIVSPFWAALFGVGLQDVGKEAAKIKATAPAPVLPAKK